MAFRFTLAGVLRLRSSLERAEKARLLVLLAEMVQIRTEVIALDEEMQRAAVSLRSKLGQGITGAELELESSLRQQREKLRLVLLRKLAGLEVRRRKQVEIYRRVRQQREILESLQARQLAQYELEQRRREQMRLDELFLLSIAASSDE
jgi:flagellar export protein FliJ